VHVDTVVVAAYFPTVQVVHIAEPVIRKYHDDNNNNPPNPISFMSDIPITSGKYSEFVLLLFLRTHRETDRFFFNFRSVKSPTVVMYKKHQLYSGP
jgi:hypothetical protein